MVLHVKKILHSITFGSGTERDFVISATIPDESVATAVFGVVHDDTHIALTKSHRGWESPGGHIEIGETIEEAFVREMAEEIGQDVVLGKLFGYQETRDKKQVINKTTGKPYPNPSYIPWYKAPLETHVCDLSLGEDIEECGIFTFAEAKNLVNDHHWRIIEFAISLSE